MKSTVTIIDSILDSIKRLLGAEIDYEHYDPEIIIGINACLSILNQLGVGLPGFRITDNTETWYDFLKNTNDGSVRYDLEEVKEYVYLKVKLIFDPPQSSAAIASFEKLIAELEWRIYIKEDDMATMYMTKADVEKMIEESQADMEALMNTKVEDFKEWELENDRIRTNEDVGAANDLMEASVEDAQDAANKHF